jgi:predicted NBD/HSP70 family sugar kinase
VREQTASPMCAHGNADLPAVTVDSYNVGIRDKQGFLGDRATKSAFREILEHWRKPLRTGGRDPLGKVPSEALSKKALDQALESEDPEAAGVLQGAIEDFARTLACIIRRLLELKAWRDTERVVIGGGLRATRVGERIIGRTDVILATEGPKVELVPVRHDPDEAGLIGAVHLVPSWTLKGHDAILAADIGGTNIRAGIVTLDLKRAPDLSKAAVRTIELWRHADEEPSREQAVDELGRMLRKLAARARKERLRLAPFIGIGCPGRIEEDGSIARAAQNLPGNWESKSFNLPARLVEAIPERARHETVVLMHNDAVVQGLSELPAMQDVERWGILTIGTGLGNARFTNRKRE